MQRCRVSLRLSFAIPVAVMACLGGLMTTASGQDQDADNTIQVPADAAPTTLFADFLHFARLGRFNVADSYAKALLAHPDLDPVEILAVADRDRQSVKTLTILIANSSIGENAAKVLALLHRGEVLGRKEPERIRENITKLGGNPQQEHAAIRHLAESGEYAIPAMISALLDPKKATMKRRILDALPLIGKPAVNPLVYALNVADNDLRLNLIDALAKIGYPQAVPYLRKLTVDTRMPEETKAAAVAAIARIESRTGRPYPGSADELFFRLAEQYYDENPSVEADARLDTANVWRWDDATQTLVATEIPQRIFGSVMAMRCCDEALHLRPDGVHALGLWLASNIRRESRLGFDIESGDPNESGEPDDTRPAVFPRALYFTQAAGPRYAHFVLARAVHDADASVALGAIKALRITAGEASLVGAEDIKQPLVQALRFPNLLVRLRAALALGAALPKSDFADSQYVVPLLAQAVTLSGRPQIAVIDPDENRRNRIMAALRDADAEAIGGTDFYATMTRVREEFRGLDGAVIASNVAEPNLAAALAQLRAEFMYAKTPLIVLSTPGHEKTASDLVQADGVADSVAADADAQSFMDGLERIRTRTAQTAIDGDTALAIAIQAAETLRMIAVTADTVFDVAPAEKSLIAALSSNDEELQVQTAGVLALLATDAAQQAIAHVGLADDNSESLRVAAFGALAESAKNHGNMLDEHGLGDLVKLAREEPNLVLRTAASQALGALNLADSQASEIIRAYSQEARE